MILRDRQKVFVERSTKALNEHGNTLGVAPTGSGKTVMLSAVIRRILAETRGRALVLAPPDEITAPNIQKIRQAHPRIPVSLVVATMKHSAAGTKLPLIQTLTPVNQPG